MYDNLGERYVDIVFIKDKFNLPVQIALYLKFHDFRTLCRKAQRHAGSAAVGEGQRKAQRCGEQNRRKRRKQRRKPISFCLIHILSPLNRFPVSADRRAQTMFPAVYPKDRDPPFQPWHANDLRYHYTPPRETLSRLKRNINYFFAFADSTRKGAPSECLLRKKQSLFVCDDGRNRTPWRARPAGQCTSRKILLVKGELSASELLQCAAV